MPALGNGRSVTLRDRPLGPWSNWFLALGEMYQRDPFADAYMLVQDDALFCKNVRALLESLGAIPRDVALISPYCPQVYQRDSTGVVAVDAGWCLIGAVTLVIPAHVVVELLVDRTAIAHRKSDPERGRRHIDAVVGLWAQKSGRCAWYLSPSVVQHIGDTSTIYPREGAVNPVRSAHFVGEEFDALSLGPQIQESLGRHKLDDESKRPNLEIGPGDHPVEGFDTLDLIERTDVTYVARWGVERLPIEDERYEHVFCSHVLEHVPWYQTEDALREVHRILKPGGTFECWVPDIQYIVSCYQQRTCGDSWRRHNPHQDPMRWVNGRIFTYGPGEENWHRACFDSQYLRECFAKAGFSRVEQLQERTMGISHGPIDLGMRAVKS